MDRIIQSPGKYIQGAGAIKRLGDYLKPLAERWLVVGDKFVLGFAEEMLRKSLADAGLAAEIAPFGGECSHNEINRLRDIAGNAKCTAVLGIGGGKTLDTAKALAHFMNVPVAIAPTIASTDAPCSALSVIYTDEGEFDSYLMLPRNPNMVIVDTQIVAGARWLDTRTLEMTWIYPQTAFRDRVVCGFDGDRVSVARTVNVNSAGKEQEVLVGNSR